jgi:hypothetical protein
MTDSPKLAALASPEGISGRLGAALRWPERLVSDA